MELISQIYETRDYIKDESCQEYKNSRNINGLAKIKLKIAEKKSPTNLWGLINLQSAEKAIVTVVTEEKIKLGEKCEIIIIGSLVINGEIIYIQNLGNNLYQLEIKYL